MKVFLIFIMFRSVILGLLHFSFLGDEYPRIRQMHTPIDDVLSFAGIVITFALALHWYREIPW